MKNFNFSLRQTMPFYNEHLCPSIPKIVLLLALVTLPFQNGNAQVERSSELYKTIMDLDRIIFEEAFNKCEFSEMVSIVVEDLEFYHDQGGLSTTREAFMQAVKQNICGNWDRKPIRKLVDSSHEVFPLYNNGVLYGAIQKGIHEFFIKEPEKELYKTNIAKFTHVWIKVNDQWILKRVLSYDHQEPPVNEGTAALDKQFNANFPTTLFDKEADINAMLKQHNIPSIGVGYIHNGALQQVRVFGNNKVGQPASHNSIYKVASLTKPVTALVALKLINANQWDLDAPIQNYYIDADVKDSPELKKLTTRHILSHQSGFPNWRYLKDSEKLYFEFEPGTRFQYSGEGFEYLRKALEKKFKKPLEVLAKELIFEPLGMKDTHFYWSDAIKENQYAVEHDENGNPIAFEKYKEANAAANLMTTITDYGKFMVHVLNGAGLSDDLYNAMMAKQVSVKEGVDFGLGWEIFNDLGNNEFAIQHTGGDYGTKCIAILLPNSKRGLLIFTNSENGMVIWKKIIEEFFGKTGTELVYKNLN